MKDVDNALQVERQPGPLVDLLGGRVEQFYALDQSVPITGDAGTGKATIWAEALSTSAPDATTRRQASAVGARPGRARVKPGDCIRPAW